MLLLATKTVTVSFSIVKFHHKVLLVLFSFLPPTFLSLNHINRNILSLFSPLLRFVELRFERNKFEDFIEL